jgi:hypothetical protein
MKKAARQAPSTTNSGNNSWAEQEEAFFGWSGNTGNVWNENGCVAGGRDDSDGKKSPSTASKKISSGAISAFRNVAKVGVRHLTTKASTWSQYPGLDSKRQGQESKHSPSEAAPIAPCVPRNTRSIDHGSSLGALIPSSLLGTDKPLSKPPPPLYLPPFSSLSNLATRVLKNCTSVVPHCVVCGAVAPTRYQFHPFFPKEIACFSHSNIGKCNSCGRFEPLENFFTSSHPLFIDLEDNQRKICPACFRSVILDAQDVFPLWLSVVNFLDNQLHLFTDVPVKSQMENIPILIVGHNGLNDPSVRGSDHGANTRGLCMYEYTFHPLGGHLKEYLNSYRRSQKSTNRASEAVSSVLNMVTKGLVSSNVTAILCLKGLPRDLTGSILAHEATHAWFKLHPQYDPNRTMPLQVEEGCCQLMAYLFLTHVQEVNNDRDAPDVEQDGQPTDKKLRQYFRYSIETDTSDIYGEGFRLAAASYAKIGNVAAFLDHVATHQSFPLL